MVYLTTPLLWKTNHVVKIHVIFIGSLGNALLLEYASRRCRNIVMDLMACDTGLARNNGMQGQGVSKGLVRGFILFEESPIFAPLHR